jgi:hypothetical protein
MVKHIKIKEMIIQNTGAKISKMTIANLLEKEHIAVQIQE